MDSVIDTGNVIGKMMRQNTPMNDAPSSRADSTSESGMPRMYSVPRYTPMGSPMPMYGMSTPRCELYRPNDVIIRYSGTMMDCRVSKIPMTKLKYNRLRARLLSLAKANAAIIESTTMAAVEPTV